MFLPGCVGVNTFVSLALALLVGGFVAIGSGDQRIWFFIGAPGLFVLGWLCGSVRGDTVRCHRAVLGWARLLRKVWRVKRIVVVHLCYSRFLHRLRGAPVGRGPSTTVDRLWEYDNEIVRDPAAGVRARHAT
jgi:hypothetical protein